jgi:AGZA family xanthine/uracil permease-like MFS transporter
MKMGYTWQQCLGMTFISGLIFLIITLSPLRNKIIEAIPAQLKRAISVGIGMFIALIGLINAGIVTANNNLLDLGTITSGTALLAIIGLIITSILLVFKVRGAILYSIIATTLIGIPLGVTNTAVTFNFENLSLAPTFFQLSFTGLTALGIFPLITSILTLCMCDCFDTVGTLTGCAAGCDMLDEDGNMKSKDMSRALTADAIATVSGSLLGTSTVTTFVESSTGVAAGARTGLASVVTGLLFALACLLAPIAGIIPSAATAPALIIVGIFMMKNVKYIDWSDMEIAIPAFLTIAMMPFGYSISDGIGFGIISYVLIKMCRGKFKEINPLMYVLAGLFILMYAL